MTTDTSAHACITPGARHAAQAVAQGMRHLFCAAGRRSLRHVMADAPLLAFDFDGTLAPIVDRPDDACVPASLLPLLQALAARCPLAVITGRRVDDVRRRLGFEPRFVVGNHGAEGLRQEVEGALADALNQVRQRLHSAGAALHAAGVEVEDKGLSLALHYRLAPDQSAAQAAIATELTDLPPELARFGGKCVENVVAADAPDKGDAVVELLQRSGCRSVLFVGDDVNDEAVFRRAQPHWLTVRIGRDHPQSRAAFFLDDHREMRALLRLMLGRVQLPSASASSRSGPANRPAPTGRAP